MTNMNIGPQNVTNGSLINAGTFNQYNNNVPVTIEQLLLQSEPEVIAFINRFSDSVKACLLDAKQFVYDYLVSLEEHERVAFLLRYRYPYKIGAYGDHDGITDIWRLLILCHIAYPNWALDSAYITHNLFVEQDQWRRIIHSCWNQQSMPTIIIHLAMSQKKHLGRENIFPHRLVITNGDQKKDNLCQHCGKQSFPFDKILKDFGKTEDRLIFTGAGYENSFRVLEEVEVYDGYCMMSDAIDSTDDKDLIVRVRRVL